MEVDSPKDIDKLPNGTGEASWLEVVTPLAKHLNCLDIKKIAYVCINDLPRLIGARLASLYILDESSDILHLQKNNHPFLINNIVSLNQNPPSPMVVAVRSKELLVVSDVESQKNPYMGQTQRAFTRNYKTKSCIIAPLICLGRVVGVLNLTDKDDGKEFAAEDVSVIELFRQLIGASIGNINLFEKTQRQAETERVFMKEYELASSSFVVTINEGWRGEVSHCLLTDDKGQIERYKVKDPSFHNWTGLAMSLRNDEISDFPLCNKSFNLSYCGFDL